MDQSPGTFQDCCWQWYFTNIFPLTWISTVHKKLRFTLNMMISQSPFPLAIYPLSWISTIFQTVINQLCLLIFSDLLLSLQSFLYGMCSTTRVATTAAMVLLPTPKICSVALRKRWSHWIPSLRFQDAPAGSTRLCHFSFHKPATQR